VSKPGQVGLLVIGIWAAASAAGNAQNLDAGKTPAQMFADTCVVCHRSARTLGRVTAAFLRQHYMTGYEEASAMANYLTGVPGADARNAQPKRPPANVGTVAVEPARQQPKEQPKQQAAVEQSKAGQSGQAQARGRRPPAAAEVTQIEAAPALEDRTGTERVTTDRAAPTPALPSQPPPAPPPPRAAALEPFEE
jgi:hypothetical protein